MRNKIFYVLYSQHCKNTKKTNNNLIGNKRPRNDTNNSNNDLISMIDDFIYTKKKMLNENEKQNFLCSLLKNGCYFSLLKDKYGVFVMNKLSKSLISKRPKM